MFQTERPATAASRAPCNISTMMARSPPRFLLGVTRRSWSRTVFVPWELTSVPHRPGFFFAPSPKTPLAAENRNFFSGDHGGQQGEGPRGTTRSPPPHPLPGHPFPPSRGVTEVTPRSKNSRPKSVSHRLKPRPKSMSHRLRPSPKSMSHRLEPCSS